jgi:hypothetical protein
MEILSTSFQDFKFLHLGWDANNGAHRCAREVLGVLLHVRYDVIPGFFTDLIQSL